jgi:hypothetical protein
MWKKEAKKTRRLPKEIVQPRIEIEDKIPLSKCRQILKEMDVKYTDDEILLVRNWLYDLAAITYDEYFNDKGKIIPLTQKQDDYEESNYLRAS